MIKYYDYALDLGFAFTAWKVQGLTFEYIIICIDGKKPWSFENLYVVFSRVKTNEGIRCLPLSNEFNPISLKSKLPNIWTTRWRLDTLNNLKWCSNPSNAKLRMKIKKKSKAEAYEEARQRFERQNLKEMEIDYDHLDERALKIVPQ